MSDLNIMLCLQATWETVYVVAIATLLAGILGLPIAILMTFTSPKGLLPNTAVYALFAGVVNATRSIPFVILMILVLPLTRLIIGTSIGPNASLVPLAISATPFIAKLFQNVMEEIPSSMLESGLAMGATHRQIITRIILPESLPGLVNATTVTAIALISYAVMSGAILGGGLGELAINYGYQRFNLGIMFTTVLILMTLVQLIQMIGDFIARRI